MIALFFAQAEHREKYPYLHKKSKTPCSKIGEGFYDELGNKMDYASQAFAKRKQGESCAANLTLGSMNIRIDTSLWHRSHEIRIIPFLEGKGISFGYDVDRLKHLLEMIDIQLSGLQNMSDEEKSSGLKSSMYCYFDISVGRSSSRFSKFYGTIDDEGGKWLEILNHHYNYDYNIGE